MRDDGASEVQEVRRRASRNPLWICLRIRSPVHTTPHGHDPYLTLVSEAGVTEDVAVETAASLGVAAPAEESKPAEAKLNNPSPSTTPQTNRADGATRDSAMSPTSASSPR